MINLPPKGLIVNLVTPLNQRGLPDTAALGGLMDRLEPFAAGFLIGSLRCGEALGFTDDSRLHILETGLQHQKNIPLFFEITGQNIDKTHHLLDLAENHLKKHPPRADVFYFLTPLTYHGNRELPAHLKTFGPLTQRRIIISNNPDLVGRYRSRLKHKNIRTAVIKKMAPIEQMAGMEFDGDLTRALNYQRALKVRQGFRLYDGNEINFLNRPSSSGLISVGACLAPEAWSDVVKSSLNIHDSQRLYPDHLNRIWQHGQLVRRLLDLYQDNPAAFIKAALHQMNLIPSQVVTPGTADLTEEQAQTMSDLLTDLGLL